MEFKQDLKSLLLDEFVANIEETDEGFKITFLNGTTYVLNIEKVA